MEGRERAIRKEVQVRAKPGEVWTAWTTREAATFFAPAVNIEMRSGGPYEILFDPNDDRQGTRGLQLLSYLPEEMVSFQWNAPPEFPTVRAIPTFVVVQITPSGAFTKVTLTQLGWREGPEWDAVFTYFTKAWDIVLARLQDRFEKGPIDWEKPSTPRMTG